MTCFNSSGMSGIVSSRTCISPSPSFQMTVFTLPNWRRPCSDSRRGTGRRGFPCGRWRHVVIGFGHRQQVVQVHAGVPAGVVLAVAGALRLLRAVPRVACRPSRACIISSSVRTMPTRSCIMSCRSCCTLYGFSLPRGLVDEATAPMRGRLRSDRCGPWPAAFSLANFAAYSPARLPKTSRSRQRVAAEAIGAVDARRTFTAGEEAGDLRHLRIAIDADAAHDVVRRRADFHRLLGDVDVAQLLELVVHARQLLLDVLGRVETRFFDPSAKVSSRGRRRRAGCRGRASTSRTMQRATWSRVSNSGGRRASLPGTCRPGRSGSLLPRCRRSAACSCPGCRRT